MSLIKCPKQYCGEVFITNNYLMMLECKFCTEEFVPYDDFLKHVFEKHFDNIEVYESDTEEDNDAEMDIFNAQESDYETTDPTSIVQTEIEREITTYDTSYRDESASVQSDHKQKQSALLIKAAAPNKNFRAVSKRVLAIKTKERPRQYKCRFCENLYGRRDSLRSHEKRHTNNRAHCCTKCDKKFFTKPELTVHMRWRHTGERPYVCPYCGRDFVTGSSLISHERSHVKDRKFKCDQCDKSYYSGDSLKKHRTVHTGERNYQCKVCSSTFNRWGSWRNHMKLHENALSYQCNLCTKRFNQKPALIWHKKRNHNIATEADAVISETPLSLQTTEAPDSYDQGLTCDPCELTFADNHSLLEHQLLVHACEEEEEGEIETILDLV